MAAPRTEHSAPSVTGSRRTSPPSGYFLPLLPFLDCARSLAATLFCVFVEDLLDNILLARLASFLLVGVEDDPRSH